MGIESRSSHQNKIFYFSIFFCWLWRKSILLAMVMMNLGCLCFIIMMVLLKNLNSSFFIIVFGILFRFVLGKKLKHHFSDRNFRWSFSLLVGLFCCCWFWHRSWQYIKRFWMWKMVNILAQKQQSQIFIVHVVLALIYIFASNNKCLLSLFPSILNKCNEQPTII